MHLNVRRTYINRNFATFFLIVFFGLILILQTKGEVNSGSDGSDGAFYPTTNTVINMTDHPDGVYHYTEVIVPAGVTVSFLPNANNTPVIWLVQTRCVIRGTVSVSASNLSYGASSSTGLPGGPGGYAGGNSGALASQGRGPGGGQSNENGGNASFGTVGERYSSINRPQGEAGMPYGNCFILPQLGGSGGGGATVGKGGGGGGGSILIAASEEIEVTGGISATGADGSPGYVCYDTPTGIYRSGGGGSGGSIRLVTTRLSGNGTITVAGGRTRYYSDFIKTLSTAGAGRIRLDYLESLFSGTVVGPLTQGFQPIILPVDGQGIQLAIMSIAGVAVPDAPSGALVRPDIIVSAQQQNPIPVVVACTGIPLNTEISIVVHPAIGSDVQGVGFNTAGTLASSTATVSLNLPRGGGIIYARAVTGINSNSFASAEGATGNQSIVDTGWTTDGEPFTAVEVTAAVGGGQQVVYLTGSGKRYPMPSL